MKRGFKTLFTWLFVFGLLRLTCQAVGVAYAVQGLDNTGLIIAFMVLSAQGFLALIFTSFRETAHEQRVAFGSSWFDQKVIPFRLPLNFIKTPFSIMRLIMIAGAVLFIIGGVEMSSGFNGNTSSAQQAKNLRIGGASLYAVAVVALICFSWYAFLVEKIRTRSMVLVLVCGPFLLVRVIYNFLYIYVVDMAEFKYRAGNIVYNPRYILYESILAALMEFIACMVLTFAFLCAEPAPPPLPAAKVTDDEEKMYE